MRAERDSVPFSGKPSTAAFTLVEMLVASVVLVIILGIVFTLTTQISSVWRSSTSRIQTFQEARAGFEAMTRRIGQATLNTYYDYYHNSAGTYTLRTTSNASTFVPTTYDRVSDLHFISGQEKTLLAGSTIASAATQTHAVFFQAPLGYSVNYLKLTNSLNACGYFLQFDDAASTIPTYVKNGPSYKPRYRFRLMEMLQPSENLGVYYGGVNDWFMNNAATNSRILAENVIALVILPKLPPAQDTSGTAMAPTYNFDSRIPMGTVAPATDPNWPAAATPAFPADGFTATNSSGTAVNMTRHNQLPPILHVLMVVIDEPSAIRLQGASTTVPSALKFSSLTPPLFTDSTKLNADLQSVQDICTAKTGNLTGNTIRLNYRIFDADIVMRAGQWSND